MAGKQAKCTNCGTMFGVPREEQAPPDILDDLPPPAGGPQAYVPPAPPVPAWQPTRFSPHAPPLKNPKKGASANQNLVIVSIAVSGLVMVGAVVLAIILLVTNKDRGPVLVRDSRPADMGGGGGSAPMVLGPNGPMQAPAGQPNAAPKGELPPLPAMAVEPIADDVDLDAAPYAWQDDPVLIPHLSFDLGNSTFVLKLPTGVEPQPPPIVPKGQYFDSDAKLYKKTIDKDGYIKLWTTAIVYSLDTADLTYEQELARAEIELRQALGVKAFRKGKVVKGNVKDKTFAQFRWTGRIDGQRICGYLAMGKSGYKEVLLIGICTGPPSCAAFKYMESVIQTIRL